MISNTELPNNLSAGDQSVNMNFHGSLPTHQRPVFPLMTFANSVQSSFSPDGLFCDPITQFLPSAEGSSHENSTIKANPQAETLMNSSFHISGTGLVGDNMTNGMHRYGGKKRKRSNEGDREKPREVVHVRARRGQATDSHSLAERLRREKINEKMRSLQDLVPGCYKTMGMSVMLDVIINYVRSLQNQIEFLSMKLSAASLFYDFNSSEMEALETAQGTNGYEAAQLMERMVGEGEGNGGFPYFQSTWPF